MSPRRAGWGTLRWRVDTGQSEVCRQLGEDEGWPADNGVRRRTRPASNPRSRSGVARTAANNGMGESAFPPTPPPPGYVPNGLRIPERQREGEGVKHRIFLLTIISRVSRCSIFGVLIICRYLGCLKLGIFAWGISTQDLPRNTKNNCMRAYAGNQFKIEK